MYSCLNLVKKKSGKLDRKDFFPCREQINQDRKLPRGIKITAEKVKYYFQLLEHYILRDLVSMKLKSNTLRINNVFW